MPDKLFTASYLCSSKKHTEAKEWIEKKKASRDKNGKERGKRPALITDSSGRVAGISVLSQLYHLLQFKGFLFKEKNNQRWPGVCKRITNVSELEVHTQSNCFIFTASGFVAIAIELYGSPKTPGQDWLGN